MTPNISTNFSLKNLVISGKPIFKSKPGISHTSKFRSEKKRYEKHPKITEQSTAITDALSRLNRPSPEKLRSYYKRREMCTNLLLVCYPMDIQHIDSSDTMDRIQQHLRVHTINNYYCSQEFSSKVGPSATPWWEEGGAHWPCHELYGHSMLAGIPCYGARAFPPLLRCPNSPALSGRANVHHRLGPSPVRGPRINIELPTLCFVRILIELAI